MMSFSTPTNRGPIRRVKPWSAGKGSKGIRTPFKSPMRKAVTEEIETEGKLKSDIEELKKREQALDKEITTLTDEGYQIKELDEHIHKLHRYNEIKDVGQMVLGRIAEILGTTTRELYTRYGLDLDD